MDEARYTHRWCSQAMVTNTNYCRESILAQVRHRDPSSSHNRANTNRGILRLLKHPRVNRSSQGGGQGCARRGGG